ncbi:hypothetical protein [Paraglaciecola sp. 20A4]|uniref:hypothetical protein n=1 Tax=Paraglaciecola sp. 20A4 TaxID=2687288 RepID=UPI00140C1A08|nr:hypothetical protein [Paraglaciecola sp. 20A4]
MNKFFILLALMMTVGCSKKEDSFIGYFTHEHAPTKSERIIHIKEDAGKLYISENVLKRKPYEGLSASDGKFELNGGTLSLSDDTNTLLLSHALGGIQAARVSKEYVDSKISEIEDRENECKSVNAQFITESTNIPYQDWNSFVDEFKKSVPSECRVKGLNKRW